MKLRLDMNLTPMWVGFLQENGFEAAHWSAVGDLTAADVTLMDWARRDDYAVFTTDLDFSARSSPRRKPPARACSSAEPKTCYLPRLGATSFASFASIRNHGEEERS